MCQHFVVLLHSSHYTTRTSWNNSHLPNSWLSRPVEVTKETRKATSLNQNTKQHKEPYQQIYLNLLLQTIKLSLCCHLHPCRKMVNWLCMTWFWEEDSTSSFLSICIKNYKTILWMCTASLHGHVELRN